MHTLRVPQSTTSVLLVDILVHDDQGLTVAVGKVQINHSLPRLWCSVPSATVSPAWRNTPAKDYRRRTPTGCTLRTPTTPYHSVRKLAHCYIWPRGPGLQDGCSGADGNARLGITGCVALSCSPPGRVARKLPIRDQHGADTVSPTDGVVPSVHRCTC